MQVDTDAIRHRAAVEYGKAYAAFASGFRVSKRGNLWRMWNGVTVCVYRRGDCYWWSIADHLGPRYSQKSWHDEEVALMNLWRELSGGGI